MQTAKRILKKAAAEDEDPLGGPLNCRNTPFEDIGVSSAKLLSSTNTNDDNNSSTSLVYLSRWIVIVF